jgi:hypothetical protein
MIYRLGVCFTSIKLEYILKLLSLVPTMVCVKHVSNLKYLMALKSAFAEKLGLHEFNPYPMFVVDLLHKFELGVWKTTFTHII